MIDHILERLKDNIIKQAQFLLDSEIKIFNQVFKDNQVFKENSKFEFILAGNSLNGGNVNDLDIYGNNCNILYNITLQDKLLFTSKNATSIQGEKYKIQFCSYHKSTLKELIDSFDFSMVQVGVLVEYSNEHLHVRDVYYSNNYLDWKLNGAFEFTGSEYPLASLFRLFKYFKRECCTKSERNKCLLKILNNVIGRGFTSYDDYKDQLDAIDLGLSEHSEEAYSLFQTIEESELIKPIPVDIDIQDLQD